ncbi:MULTISPECIES: kynureninase [Fictibacillus]|uniref:Kynureninase n=1 Tax=Fictibacillus enclensis TaxID=1017270 RepID=A0A0V8J965_9BACL|nr:MULTISPECIES: kynureninase [Fictibacillus]KSU83450.1 kynureninase [Fictibacillus enclensis]RXZ02270.1 kynureninase [Fictibacillus sp. S7]SCC15688.1 Kynureninase [Fictibacillus enclensis]
MKQAYWTEMDGKDGLKHFKEEFYVKKGVLYMDGNSLGLLSKNAEKTLAEVLTDWKEYGIDGWMAGTHPWFTLSEKLGGKMAPLIGAHKDEVIVTGSTTGNLHQLVSTFFQPAGTKTKILADELTFPSDIYALKSQLHLKSLTPADHLLSVKSQDGRMIEEEDIISSMTEEVALIVLPSVLYRSGQLLDIQRLTAEAHKRGILIGFDLCHSIGAVPHELSNWEVDFAFWCNYKYLNGGPGSVAGLYVNRKHFKTAPGLAGWFGSNKEKQFDMSLEFVPSDTAGAFQMGTPHVLSTAPLIGSLELFAEAGMGRLREKSLQLTRYMMELIETELSSFGFHIGNPREDERRGGHVCLEHSEAARICKALKENQVVPDFRAPNVIRLAPVPLYTSFQDVHDTIVRLKKIMSEKQYEKFPNVREVIA